MKRKGAWGAREQINGMAVEGHMKNTACPSLQTIQQLGPGQATKDRLATTTS